MKGPVHAESEEDGVDVLGSKAEAIPGGGTFPGPCSAKIPPGQDVWYNIRIVFRIISQHQSATESAAGRRLVILCYMVGR